MTNIVMRHISIDMGHRVHMHGSKCANMHGHRYTVEAHCYGQLQHGNEQDGMVLDFGFLKEEMMNEIDKPCDHGFCFSVKDGLCVGMFQPDEMDSIEWQNHLNEHCQQTGYFSSTGRGNQKIYVIPYTPTAENLARHWFNRLKPKVEKRTDGKSKLKQITVWETPNCSATYDGEIEIR